jgi:hypothetical protein
MYQVGFGDCFLVSLEYPRALPDGRAERHLLIDFGTTRYPREGSRSLAAVASLVAEHCHGQLDVVVASHRHKDHLEGFGNEEAATTIGATHPSLVVRSWTEDPVAPADARGPASLGASSRSFALALREGEAFAAVVAQALRGARGIRAAVGRFALDQVSNKDAVDRLTRWGDETAASYVFAGSPSGIEELVPGVRVRVLGPPTLEQWPEVAGQREDDPEYWIQHRRRINRALGTKSGADALSEAAAVPPEERIAEPGPIRWLVERMRDQQVASLLRIVRTLDDALNNTSVILLLDVGEKRLLFPGDAQIENWSYALKATPEARSIRGLLRYTDLYKVGHHGSRNATPKSLFALWGFDPDPARPMAAMMSTLSGVHGESEATRVPRATLVTALERRMGLHSTDGLASSRDFVELQAPASGSEPFVAVE